MKRPVGLRLPLVPLLAALAAGLFAILSSGDGPAQSFYGTAATIIPILLVALAVEGQGESVFYGPNAKAHRRLLLTFLLLGEACALLGASGIFRGHIPAGSARFEDGAVAESHVLRFFIAAGTGAGLIGEFVMIAVLAVGPQGTRREPVRPSPKARDTPDG